jgi:hypothetical protein
MLIKQPHLLLTIFLKISNRRQYLHGSLSHPLFLLKSFFSQIKSRPKTPSLPSPLPSISAPPCPCHARSIIRPSPAPAIPCSFTLPYKTTVKLLQKQSSFSKHPIYNSRMPKAEYKTSNLQSKNAQGKIQEIQIHGNTTRASIHSHQQPTRPWIPQPAIKRLHLRIRSLFKTHAQLVHLFTVLHFLSFCHNVCYVTTSMFTFAFMGNNSLTILHIDHHPASIIITSSLVLLPRV